MEIVQPRKTVHVKKYFRQFDWRDQPGAGFSFECYESGFPIVIGLAPQAFEHLQKCLTGEYDVVSREGIIDGSYDYQEPAQGRCTCGTLVTLEDPMTNACEHCGQLYNGFGQALAPREQWEEIYEPEDYY